MTTYHSIPCFECGSRRTKRMGTREYFCCDCGTALLLFVGSKAGAYTLPLKAAEKVEATRAEMMR